MQMNNFTTAQPYLQSTQNKAVFYGDEKTLKQKRGADLLKTEEESDDNNDLNDRIKSPQYPKQNISNIFYAASSIKNSINLRDSKQRDLEIPSLDKLAASKIALSGDKSRTMKNQNNFNAFNELKAKKPIDNPAQQRIYSDPEAICQASINDQTASMGMKFFFSKLTINMNQFGSPPQEDPTYEDKDFYESLNYSKMNSQALANKKTKAQNSETQHYNATMQNMSPWGKPAGGISTLSQKISNLTSATMNTQANAIIKTVSIVNPYADDLSKTTKNINQPQSQQVSRAQSRVGMNNSDDEDDIDEISHEIQKKKVVKKKIIKKIVKKRNPDGTEAPPQVSTYIIEKDGSKTNPNSTFVSALQNSKNPNQTISEPIKQYQDSIVKPINYNQTQVDLRPDEAPKKKVKKIIIKKKKKVTDTELQGEIQIGQIQAQKEVFEREEALKRQLLQEQEAKAILEQKLKFQQQQQEQLLKQQQLDLQIKEPAKKKNVIKLKRSQIKQAAEQQRGSQPQQEEEDSQRVHYSKADKKKERRRDESEEEDDDDDGIDKDQTRNPNKISKMEGKKSRNQYKTVNPPPKRRREDTEEVGQSSEEDSDDGRNKKKQQYATTKKKRKPRDSDEEDSEEEKVARKQQRARQQQKRSHSAMDKKKPDQNAKKQPIKRNAKQSESEDDSDESGEDSEEENSNSDQEESANSEEQDSSVDSHDQRMKNFKRQQMKLQQQQEELNQKKKELQKAQIQQSGTSSGSKKDQPLIQKPLTFKVAVCDAESYKAYVDQLVFGNRAKDLIINPIPFQMGQLKFTIERHRSGFNRLHPSYYFYLEKNQGGRVLMLYAKKRAFNKTANYLISMEKNKSTRNNDVCLGKLRANPEGDKYILYDNGENHTKVSHQQKDKIRTEHGIYSYRYEPCNVGNIRKMIVIIPALTQINLPQGAPLDNTLPLGQDQDGNIVVMTQKIWQPLREQDTMMETFTREGFRNQNYQIFVDNPPAWNPKTNTYVYDFKGRVTQPSIKNFQLIPEQDGRRQVTLQDFVLQFGKNGKDAFILDVQYPFSIFQAFGLALSAFDTD